ncbi:MAG: hypothetical protein R3D25_15225 [Geminicoccaceae bacterium]
MRQNGFDTRTTSRTTAAQLTAAASDLLLWHGLSSAQITQIAEADVGRWADRAMQTVCARGLRLNWHPAESAYCSALLYFGCLIIIIPVNIIHCSPISFVVLI